MLEVEFSLRCLKSNMYSQLLMVRILVFPQNSCKSRKSRDTWSNRQIWTRRTKQSRAKPNRLLPRKCTGDRKYLLPTTQEKMLHMNITRWSIPKSDWLYSLQPKMEKLYTVSKNKTWNWLWLRSSAKFSLTKENQEKRLGQPGMT